MASGIFPLQQTDPDGARIGEIVDYLRGLAHDIEAGVMTGESGGNQFDNAAIDGMALARLQDAAHLLELTIVV